jgi:Protein of unknown function (DUF4239)
MSPLTTSLAVFGCVTIGALLGMRGHSLLPDHHRSPETKEVVRLGMALVGTMVALVLGLLVGSGKGYYDTQNSEVTQLAADVRLLNKILIHYGPEAQDVQDLLRTSVAHIMDVTWARDGSGKPHSASSTANEEALFEKLQQLSPHNDNQRFLLSQALNSAIKLGQTRALMAAQGTSSVPTPLVAMLTLWLTLLFMSFGIFVRPNVTVLISLLVSALAVCGAIFLILEMYQPYTGFIHVSDAPLRAALAQIGH